MALRNSMRKLIISIMTVVLLISLAAGMTSASAEARTVRVGVYPLERFHAFNAEGECAGYDVDYLNLIAKNTGWKYEYVRANSWSEAMQLLREGRIDLLSPSQITAARLNEFSFSAFPIGKVYGAVIAKGTRQDIIYEDYAAFNELAFGIEKGNTYDKIFRDYAANNGFTPHITYYKDHNALVEALEKGEIDAMVCNIMRATPGSKLIGKAGTALYYYMYRKGDLDLGHSLNEALDQIEISKPEFQDELISKYYPIYTEAPFSKAELEFLKTVPTLRVGIRDDYHPLSYVDSRGQSQGMYIDFMRQVAKNTGLKVEFVPFKGEYNIERLAENKIDAVFAVSSHMLSLAKNAKTIYSDNFWHTQEVMVTRKGLSFSRDKKLVLAYHFIGRDVEKVLEENYPNFTLMKVDTLQAALEAVVDGRADCLLAGQYLIDYMLQKPAYESLEIIPDAGMPQDVAIALCRVNQDKLSYIDDPRLVSALNKAFKQIKPDERQKIAVKYTTGQPYKLTLMDLCYKYRTALGIILVLLAVIIFAIIKNLRLRSRSLAQANELNQALEAKNEELRDAIDQAQRASEAKSSFLARMSHEIRTPMNAIVGITAIAKQHLQEPEKLRDYLSKIDSSSKVLLNLINDVLDMSAIESNRIKIAKEVFDIKEVLNNIANVYYPQCRAKGIDFELNTAELNHEFLRGDALRLNQILLNLISNAYKFTSKGGVTITVSEKALQDNTVYVHFSVADSGEGMSEEMQGRLFKKFEQESAATAQKHGGSGLGLSIAKNLVELMQGSIEVCSTKGVGTTFTVDLPFTLVDSELQVDKKRLSKIRTLIVDDEDNAREYTAIILDRIGVQYDIASGGEEACKMLQEAYDKGQGYDICFVDWKMPRLDGIAVTKRIRQLFDKDTVIIILSAYDITEVEEEARAAGANLFVSKPLFQSTVFNVLVSLSSDHLINLKEQEEEYDFTGHRLLLAEDNALNTEIAVELLELVNMQVDTAENGQVALEKFKASAPGTYDCILMDIQMPIMNGHEATKAIRACDHPEAKTIPIYAMTANAFTEDVTAALGAGMNGHIAKPIDTNILYKTLGKLIK